LSKCFSKWWNACWATYAGADDRESLENQHKEVNDDDGKKREQPWFICPKALEVKKCDMSDTAEGKKERAQAVIPDAILNRQKHTKTKKYMYEVKWMHKSVENNSWVERDSLLAMGYSKIVMKKDEQEAAAAGLLSKPLTQAGVEKALKDFGLDTEAASHSPYHSLSHGQKVKVVLAACTWAQPHLIILDEPTNYLDREALGALAGAINDFEGGICLITHNQEFADATTRETWVVANNTCDIKGDADWTAYAAEANDAMENQDGPDEIYDESGNKITVKKKMDAKDIKKEIKDIEKKLKEQKKKNNLSEEDAWELSDRLTELKSMLEAAKGD
jgi:elongation factor 3